MDESRESDFESWRREALHVEYSSEDKKYYLAAKEIWENSYGGGGEIHDDEQWIIYEVSESGSFSWDTAEWNVNIANYEDIFGYDINGDGETGFNEGNLEDVADDDGKSTDTIGVSLKRDKFTGSLYLVDDGVRKQILDEVAGTSLGSV